MAARRGNSASRQSTVPPAATPATPSLDVHRLVSVARQRSRALSLRPHSCMARRTRGRPSRSTSGWYAADADRFCSTATARSCTPTNATVASMADATSTTPSRCTTAVRPAATVVMSDRHAHAFSTSATLSP